MVRSIDPRRETVRGAQRSSNTAAMSGARVAETISASGHGRPHPTGRTYGCKRSDQNRAPHLASRGPSTYGHRTEPVLGPANGRDPWTGVTRLLLLFGMGLLPPGESSGCV